MTIKTSDQARASLDRIVARMEGGDLSPLVHVARVRMDESCPASRWTYANALLAYLQCSELDCRGYRQWKHVGRHVKKREDGGVAVYILAPRHVRDEEEKDEHGKPKIKWTFFVTIPVFPMSATDGEPVEYEGTPTEPMPLEGLAAELGIETTYMPLPAALGATSLDGSKIRMGSGEPFVWFHELAHALMARIFGRSEPGQKAHQEIPAELAAAVLMEVYQLGDRTGNAWTYIKEYADDPVEAIHRAAVRVGKILDFIFQRERSKNDDESKSS